jgi:hypothetical protein
MTNKSEHQDLLPFVNNTYDLGSSSKKWKKLHVQDASGIDHGGLGGLSDDDHPQYLRIDQTTPQYIINGSPASLAEPTFTYNIDGTLQRIDYPLGQYKAFTYNIDGTLNTIDLNGAYTKTLVWSSGVLQSIGVT